MILNYKNLALDIEKYCRNKRLKKNIYKMDLINAKNNN